MGEQLRKISKLTLTPPVRSSTPRPHQAVAWGAHRRLGQGSTLTAAEGRPPGSRQEGAGRWGHTVSLQRAGTPRPWEYPLHQSSDPGGSVSKGSTCHAGDPGSIPGSGRPPGGGHGSPLQYSCQGNPMDREAWRAHGVSKSRVPLGNYTTTAWLSRKRGKAGYIINRKTISS